MLGHKGLQGLEAFWGFGPGLRSFHSDKPDSTRDLRLGLKIRDWRFLTLVVALGSLGQSRQGLQDLDDVLPPALRNELPLSREHSRYHHCCHSMG